MELRETKLKSDSVFTGKVFEVTVDEVTLPDGRTARRDVVHSSGGVVILPVDTDGTVTLVRQYRYVQGEALLEAVAGKLEPGEDPLECARRELSEETGLEARKWTELGMLYTSPGFSTDIGNGVTVGHSCIIHGCTVEDNVLIGMGSILLDGCKIGKNSIIGAGSLVTKNTVIPDGSMAFGRPAKVVRKLTEGEIEMNRKTAEHYVDDGKRYKNL